MMAYLSKSISVVVLTVAIASCRTSSNDGASQVRDIETPAALSIVKCSGTYQEQAQELQVKINASGEIVPWEGDEPWAGGVVGDWTNIFGQVADESGAEYNRSFRVETGVAIMLIGTTADEFKFALSADRTRGSLEYSDHGSGAGNHRFDMTCEPM